MLVIRHGEAQHNVKISNKKGKCRDFDPHLGPALTELGAQQDPLCLCHNGVVCKPAHLRIRVRGRFGTIRDDSIRFGAIRGDSDRFGTSLDDSG